MKFVNYKDLFSKVNEIVKLKNLQCKEVERRDDFLDDSVNGQNLAEISLDDTMWSREIDLRA